jgi:hypothetical protein
MRQTAKTRNWEKAEDFKHEFERNMKQTRKDWKRLPGRESALVNFCQLVIIHRHYDEHLALPPEINWTTRRMAGGRPFRRSQRFTEACLSAADWV